MKNETKKYYCMDCGAEMNEGERKTFTCCDACWDKHYEKQKAVGVQQRVILQLAEVKKEFETKYLNGRNLDTLESEGFDQQDIDDIRELWAWFSSKFSKLSE